MTPFLTPLYCLAAFAVGFVAGTIIAFAYVGAKAILRRIRPDLCKIEPKASAIQSTSIRSF